MKISKRNLTRRQHKKMESDSKSENKKERKKIDPSNGIPSEFISSCLKFICKSISRDRTIGCDLGVLESFKHPVDWFTPQTLAFADKMV